MRIVHAVVATYLCVVGAIFAGGHVDGVVASLAVLAHALAHGEVGRHAGPLHALGLVHVQAETGAVAPAVVALDLRALPTRGTVQCTAI